MAADQSDYMRELLVPAAAPAGGSSSANERTSRLPARRPSGGDQPLTAEALETHQKWLAEQHGAATSSAATGEQAAAAAAAPPPASKGTRGTKFSPMQSLFKSFGVGGSSTPPPPPPGQRSKGYREEAPPPPDEDGLGGGLGGGAHSHQTSNLERAELREGAMAGSHPGGSGGGSGGRSLEDALLEGPAGAGDAARLAGPASDDEGGNSDEDDEGGSASGTEESEAEGEFKGGKGDLLTSRYLIEKEVGRGTFGRVLRCVDTDKATDAAKAKVAIKVVHNAGRYYELSLIEAEILRDVNGAGGRGQTHCVLLLNFFKLEGHACMVFETLGSSLYEFMKANEYIPFPLFCVQDFSRQMLEAISFMHRMKLVHTDLKPENVLLVDGGYHTQQVGKKKVRIPKCTRIKLIDFGCATYDDDEHKSDLIATRQYRAPEVILGLPWSYPSDIWSIGCIVAELYCGDQLFETHSNMEHVALIERGVEKWPRSLTKKSPVKTKYFDSHGLSLWRTALDAEARRHVRAMKPLAEFVGADKDTGLLSFFRAVLTVDPKKRLGAERALAKSFVRQRKK